MRKSGDVPALEDTAGKGYTTVDAFAGTALLTASRKGKGITKAAFLERIKPEGGRLCRRRRVLARGGERQACVPGG